MSLIEQSNNDRCLTCDSRVIAQTLTINGRLYHFCRACVRDISDTLHRPRGIDHADHVRVNYLLGRPYKLAR